MSAKRISALLAKPLGISDFQLTPDEPTSLIIRSLKVHLVYLSELGCIWAEIPVGPLPPKGSPNREILIRELLEADFNRQGSDGGVFSMDPLGFVFLEHQWFLPSSREEQLPDELGRAVILAENWAERLTKEAEAAHAQSDPNFIMV
ncbi:MAG: type III secretion system chaperone [Deltaproteobacteria bacterium]|jgi:hypothetical protein|nr:type III secretion system chaperone [Deltaproteobacteria bacterium]